MLSERIWFYWQYQKGVLQTGWCHTRVEFTQDKNITQRAEGHFIDECAEYEWDSNLRAGAARVPIMNSESFSAALCEPRTAHSLIIFFYIATLRLCTCNVQSLAVKINFHLMEFAPLSSHEPDSIVDRRFLLVIFSQLAHISVWVKLHIGANGANPILHFWCNIKVEASIKDINPKAASLWSRSRLQLLYGIQYLDLPYLWKEWFWFEQYASEKLDLLLLIQLIFQIAAVFLYTFHRKSAD